ncbi:MAG: Asp-tRNA(Asn)/Glu-tRNA(Gln) amidotransferase subunit GatC [bacterium]
MKIDKQQVEYVATLARLKISEEEKELFSSQLSDILGYVEKLNQLDTSGIEPTAHVISTQNIFREDRIRASLDMKEALREAPVKKNDFFEVPKVVE